jgi:primosomal replication protein N
LIEDLELKRVGLASAEGKNPEYSLFLEAVSPQGTEYWVFVVLPHENAQEWFDARRAYHGRKAADYYGRTQSELEQALNQGIKIKAELRFLIERGDISLLVPEDEIRSRYKFQPVYDLSAGRWLDPTAKTK